MTPHKNKDWKLHVFMEWRLKKGRDTKVYCIACKGRGSWLQEPGFGSYDYETTRYSCPKCNGRGTWPATSIDHKPVIPKELFDRLKLTYNQFWHECEGDDPVLAKLNAELEMYEENEDG